MNRVKKQAARESSRPADPAGTGGKKVDAPPDKAWLELATGTRIVQAKLTVGAVDDPLEREADRVADRVLRMPEAAGEESGGPVDRRGELRRKCSSCEEDEVRMQPSEAGVEVQRERTDGKASNRVADSTAQRIHSLSGRGEELSSATRAYFEPRFGRDFAEVRIHAGPQAATAARELSAAAFTSGRDIYFGSGRYRPESGEGRRLLAHELTHVVQQSSGEREAPLRRQRAKPWREVDAHFASGSRRVHLFSHTFPAGTTLAAALGWIFTHSTARPSQFRFVDRRQTLNAEVEEATRRQLRQPVSSYQEVALAWHLSRRRFIAYTTRHPTSGSTDPRQSAQLVFVAHTHPTRRQIGSSGAVQWRTTQPSREDRGHFHRGQDYSIICHRNVSDNRSPEAFIYDRSSVTQRFSGPSAFQQAAARFVALEASARKIGQSVGSYARRVRGRARPARRAGVIRRQTDTDERLPLPDCSPRPDDSATRRAEGEEPAPPSSANDRGGEDFDPNSIPERRARLLRRRGELDEAQWGSGRVVVVELGDGYDDFVRNIADRLARPFDTGRHRHRGQTREEREEANRRSPSWVVRDQFLRQSRPAPGRAPFLRTIYRRLVNNGCGPSTTVWLWVSIRRRVDEENPRGRVITDVRPSLISPQRCRSPETPGAPSEEVEQARERIVRGMPNERQAATAGEGRLEDPAIGRADGYLEFWRTYLRTGSPPGVYRNARNEQGRQRALREYRNLMRGPEEVSRAILCDPSLLRQLVGNLQRNRDRLVRESVGARPDQ